MRLVLEEDRQFQSLPGGRKKNQGVFKYKGEPKYLKFKGGSGTPKHTMAVSLQPL